MDICKGLIKYIVNTNYGDIPNDAIEAAKRDILDTLGVAIAGSKSAGVKEIIELGVDWGGKKESTVIMSGQKMPSPYAAFINSTMINALDYDDIIPGFAHVGAVIIPAGFAIAERKGGINGKDFLAAVILGIDVEYRLGRACKKTSQLGPGWLYTPLFGIFSATSVACKLLHLDEEQTTNAFGIAYSQASGNSQCVIEGALSKQMQPGFASKAGVLSALIASKGITGAKDVFEGKYGFFRLYHRGDYDAKNITQDLGKQFATVKLGFKLYPCCAQTHTAIDATLDLVTKNNIIPEDVEEITVHLSELARDLIEPLQIKQKPGESIDAQFSIPWVVATALVKRRVTIDDFTLEAIINPEVLQIAQKVKPQIGLKLKSQDTSPVIVTIKLKGPNLVYSRREDIAKGHPGKPVNWEELTGKFRDCALYGKRRLSKQKIEWVLQQVANLEQVDDAGKVIQLLC